MSDSKIVETTESSVLGELFDREPESLTEAEMLDRLRSRYSVRAGNGPRYAFVTHVRDGAGFQATRTLDAVVMDTWLSSGLALHGIEVKVSRSDWRRELAQPWKAAAFVRFVDYFWVAAARHVVKVEELPDGWGLIETRGAGLLATVQARRLTRERLPEGVREPLNRSFTASLMRAACRSYTDDASLSSPPVSASPGESQGTTT